MWQIILSWSFIFLHFLRLSLSLLLFPPAPSISLPCCSGLSLHISFGYPLCCLPHCLLPTHSFPLPSLSLARWLIHFIVGSLQVYSRKSTPAVNGLCVGVPAAEVSQMLPNHTCTSSSRDSVWFCLCSSFAVAREYNIWIQIDKSIHIRVKLYINDNVYKILTHKSRKQYADLLCLCFHLHFFSSFLKI